jgi:2-polyprenyl-3-methyl-5-hydroxy-6-metoxy-1,4-benzoquinol methylase
MSSIPKHNRYPSKVIKAWQNNLSKGGYESPPISLFLKMKITFLTRTWRRILRHTGLKLSDSVSALEFGCGGGAQIVPLFANGWRCIGVDCSKEVLSRARQYVKKVVDFKLLRNDKGSITFICDDFLNFKSETHFDMTFQFGVLEHFLNAEERLIYLRKMFETTKQGGIVVNCVPNGEHLFRAKQRNMGLGGYHIPEIDYTVVSLREEMLNCGASSVDVLTHDLMGYLKIRKKKGLYKLLNLGIYFIWQIPLFQGLPLDFKRRHAYWLIGIGEK